MLLQSKGHGRSLEHLFSLLENYICLPQLTAKLAMRYIKKRQMYLMITNLKISVEWIQRKSLKLFYMSLTCKHLKILQLNTENH